MVKEARWTVEQWNMENGGAQQFHTKAEALKAYRALKKEVREEYPEYTWKEEKDDTQLHYIATDGFMGERVVLGDMEYLV